jgi:hypothetical protein
VGERDNGREVWGWQTLNMAVAVKRLVVAGLAERVAQPFQTFVETISGGGAGGLDVLWTHVS